MPIQPLKPRESVELSYAPAPRPLGHRIRSGLRSWARGTFSRDSLVSSFKSLLWVAPLTVLIWVYAERAQVVLQKNVGITIKAPAAEPGRMVSLVGVDGGAVHADLVGTQDGVDQVRDWLESTPITLEVDHNLSPGEHPINLAAQLDDLPRLKNIGVSIKQCTPDQVRVNIDPMTELEVPVSARAAEAGGLAAPPVFMPAKVRVLGPQSLLYAARVKAQQAGGQFVAYANLKLFSKQLADPGKHDLSSVPVSVDVDNPNVTVSPVTVSAHVEVRKADQKYTLPYVRVLAASPNIPQADKYKLVFFSTVTNVGVIGPDDQIALLKEQKSIPWAVFLPDYANTDNPAPAPLTFELPAGVQLSPEDANRTITYTFKPRSGSDQ